MMTLYSGTTCPFSQRCRIVLYEKGMDFQIIDVDLYNKPEDLAVMNPYNRTPVLVERDLILYESNIINEYIDDRFPHPQLMPADPVMRARARHRIGRHQLRVREAVVDILVDDVRLVQDQVAFHQHRGAVIRVHHRQILRLVVEVHVDDLKIHPLFVEDDAAALAEWAGGARIKGHHGQLPKELLVSAHLSSTPS